MADKAVVAEAVTAFGEEFRRRYSSDSDWLRRFKAGDETSLEEVVRDGCSKHGITVEEYEKAVLSDPELQAYQNSAMGDAILADIEPGPTNPDARESAGARISTRKPRKWWQFWRSW
jgi:hypothetical protein